MSINPKSIFNGPVQILLCVVAVALTGGIAAAESAGIENEVVNAASLPSAVELANDLAAVGALSQQKGVPILLMFSTEDCNYCKRLEAEVLGPMRIAGIDPQRVILRKVVLDEYGTLRDFSGHERNAESFGNSLGVDVVPTLELLDATGKVLVPKIVGYQTPGLYAHYLEKAIEVSRSLLAQQ